MSCLLFNRMLYILFSSRAILLCFLLVFFASTIVLCLYILATENCHCPGPVTELQKLSTKDDTVQLEELAMLVPFRDRFDELLAFIPHMHTFLTKQRIKHRFFILNQIDDLRFNRASLINVGFKLIRHTFDYFVVHDVDLLPMNDNLKYTYPKKGVFHVSSPSLHPKYHYPTFLGGIVIVRSEDFEAVNGMSNRYWGWGLEDDEFYTRLKDANIEIRRPEGIATNITNTFRHIHERQKRKRDMEKCYNQRNVTRRRDRLTGLHDVKYRVTSTISLVIDSVPLSVVNIILECDRALTPWCQCAKPIVNKPSKTT